VCRGAAQSIWGINGPRYGRTPAWRKRPAAPLFDVCAVAPYSNGVAVRRAGGALKCGVDVVAVAPQHKRYSTPVLLGVFRRDA